MIFYQPQIQISTNHILFNLFKLEILHLLFHPIITLDPNSSNQGFSFLVCSCPIIALISSINSFKKVKWSFIGYFQHFRSWLQLVKTKQDHLHHIIIWSLTLKSHILWLKFSIYHSVCKIDTNIHNYTCKKICKLRSFDLK